MFKLMMVDYLDNARESGVHMIMTELAEVFAHLADEVDPAERNRWQQKCNDIATELYNVRNKIRNNP